MMRKMKTMKKICSFALAVFLVQMVMLTPVFAVENKVFDDAGLMSEEEIAQANEKIAEIVDTYACDVVVVTTNDSEGKSAMEYADDYFDYNGFGIGAERDGVILSINMDIRECWISTSGQAILWFSDREIDSMLDNIANYLGNDNYDGAVSSWLNDVEYELQYDDGSGYIIDSPLMKSVNLLGNFLLVGAIVAAIAVFVMVRMCKTAVKPALANEYVNKDSFVVRRSEDRFLRTNTTKIKIQTSSGGSGGGGGGSSVHRSSSGRSHGGGGRKF